MEYKEFDKEFQKISVLGEGSFGKVYLCRKNRVDKENQVPSSGNYDIQSNDTKTNNQSIQNLGHLYYALKKLKEVEDEKQIAKRRQVLNLKHFNHKNVMGIHGIVRKDKNYKINHYLVLDYGFQLLQFTQHKEFKLSNAILRQVIRQIVEGIRVLHHQKYVHRDIKPSNIFAFRDGTIKIGDFSITRPISQEGDMTGNITTRFYRPPEIIFGCKSYRQEVDIWSLGCTLAQLILHEPIFPGKTDIDQLQCIFQIVGYPQSVWKTAQQLPYYFQFPQKDPVGLQNLLPNVEQDLLDLINKLLTLDPKKRPTIDQVFAHEYIQKAEQDIAELQKISEYVYDKKLKQQIDNKNHQ